MEENVRLDRQNNNSFFNLVVNHYLLSWITLSSPHKLRMNAKRLRKPKVCIKGWSNAEVLLGRNVLLHTQDMLHLVITTVGVYQLETPAVKINKSNKDFTHSALQSVLSILLPPPSCMITKLLSSMSVSVLTDRHSHASAVGTGPLSDRETHFDCEVFSPEKQEKYKPSRNEKERKEEIKNNSENWLSLQPNALSSSSVDAGSG